MASSSVKLEYKLVGAANFNAWKYRIVNILEENDLEELISREIEEPTSNTARAAYKRKQTKAKRIIFDSIKDNMMPIIGHLRTAKDCFDALANLYEKKAPTQKRILKKQLRTLKMGKDDVDFSQCFLTLQFIPIPVSVSPYHSKMFNALSQY
jgi:hypothetical protein